MLIKIFKMNDADWVASETVEGAIKCLNEQFGADEASDEYLDDPKEVADTELDRLMFQDDPDEPGGGAKRTFREELFARVRRGEEFPQFFASSEI